MFCVMLAGSSLDIKEFHKAILDLGTCPLKIFEQEMDYWISQQPVVSSATNVVAQQAVTILVVLFVAIL